MILQRIYNGFINWILSFIRGVDSNQRGQVVEMAINTNFNLAFEKMLKLEFSSPKNALHWNKGETGFTFMGIYETAHPNWDGWKKIKSVVGVLSCDHLEYYSEFLYKDDELKESVKRFYKKNFWDTANLDYILVYDIAKLIFCFAVNVGVKKAIKYAQQVVGVENDGVVGKNTINALNGFNPLKFEVAYKQLFTKYYTQLAKANAKYKPFLQGWLNRVKKS